LIKLNEFGNPTAITDPMGNVTRRTWDDGMNMASLTDANGHTTAYDCDEYGNLIKKTNPLGNVTDYEWRNIDSNPEYISLLLSTTDALGHTTSYGYDGKGNLNRTTNAAGDSSYNHYDEFGNLIRYADFRGFETLYSYPQMSMTVVID
jgi:YD repeat-containing protein